MVVDVIFRMFCSCVGGGSGDFLRDFLVIIKLLSDGVQGPGVSWMLGLFLVLKAIVGTFVIRLILVSVLASTVICRFLSNLLKDEIV